ncbi:MAG: hypothetical protein NTV49_05840 [Kiritimatiellaeota bacterium]|nr:hypothetical protein [Kiritimatiellota bacterium]
MSASARRHAQFLRAALTSEHDRASMKSHDLPEPFSTQPTTP